LISIIIPTFNEREGIEDVLRTIAENLRSAGLDFEFIVVDDDSPDKTWEFCDTLKDKYPVTVVRRVGERGLSSAVIEGWKRAGGEILGVMDADGSHDSKIIPEMVRAIKAGECQLAIGSRYIPGGGTEGWPWFRIFTSRVAIALAFPITKISDATSGFCLFKKEIIEGVQLDPVGWKIVLEVAIKGKYDRYKEFPFIFRDREKGKSKLGRGAIINYIKHLRKLWDWKAKNRRERV
jgi:dolichol-phosphate mannosyltransferase